MLMNWKGACGKLPCFHCLNVVNVPRSGVLPDGCVSLSCYDKARFNPASNQDWWNKADSLLYEKTRMGKGAFKKFETATGLTLNPRGLLWDHALRPYIGPIDICTKDAMHTLLVDGVGDCWATINLFEDRIEWIGSGARMPEHIEIPLNKE